MIRIFYILVGTAISGGIYNAFNIYGVIPGIIISGVFVGAILYRLTQAYDDIRELQKIQGIEPRSNKLMENSKKRESVEEQV